MSFMFFLHFSLAIPDQADSTATLLPSVLLIYQQQKTNHYCPASDRLSERREKLDFAFFLAQMCRHSLWSTQVTHKCFNCFLLRKL